MSPRLDRRPAADPRRRQVEAALARAGLLRRPHAVGDVAGAGVFGRDLREALAGLGPVFHEFGIYLASRVDLLAAGDCLELAALPRRLEPLPQETVYLRLAAALGTPPEETFAEIAAVPFASRLPVQAHRARLRDGRPVVVQVARDAADVERAPDLELLELLGEPLAAQGASPAALAEAIAGFRRDLALRADLAHTARGLELLALDARAFGLLAAPALHRGLSGPRVLVTDDPGGLPLAAVLATGDPAAVEAARRLCVVWLRQALLGRVFPLEPDGEGTEVLADGRVSFACGSFAEPAAAVQRDHGDLLVALAARDQEGAATYLLRALRAEPGAAPEERVRLDLRQVVPFRDGAWSPAADSLAEHLFAAVRAARACGWAPREPLLELCRGLFGAAAAARRPAPEGDVLRDALQEMRVLTSLNQVREALDPLRVGSQLESYATLLADLPQRLDALLTRGAVEEPPRPAAAPVERAAPGSGRTAALLLALGAVALVARPLAGALGGLGEEVVAALFLGVGALLLWAVGRNG
ncbi:MAG TPA: AarF/UbiB family protein [Thermoanaerobaculia bacterium]|nr:AarF/UbiB family protein [Thermoanaerobaculia bacterium]